MAEDTYLIIKTKTAAVHEINQYLTESGGRILRAFGNFQTAEECIKKYTENTPDKSGGPDTEPRPAGTAERGEDSLSAEKCPAESSGAEEHVCSLFNRKRADDLNRLLTSISHHWRQPLNVLALSIQELGDLYYEKKLNDEYVDAFCKSSLEKILSMSAVIDSFKGIQKAEAEFTEKNLVLHIFDLLKLYKPELEFRNIEISFKCLCGEKNISCTDFSVYPPCNSRFVYSRIDAAKFNLAFINILDNAKDAVCDALNKRRILSGRIDIAFTVGENLMSISIKNNGEQIDDAILDKIFLPYFTTKEEGKGTGLGLFIARTTITDYFRGKLECRNCPDGVEFIILIDNTESGFCL